MGFWFEPYMIAKLFISLKSHKDGIRPIIAAPDAWGGQLSIWMLKKLELVSNLFDKVRVIGSEDFVGKIKGVRVFPGTHKLANWDYDVHKYSFLFHEENTCGAL